MSHQPERCLRVDVDTANPGQFFACCGLLELADRLWNGAGGWFDESLTEFRISSEDGSRPTPGSLLDSLAQCELRNTMKPEQRDRLASLRATRKRDMSRGDEDEKKSLEKLWRESPLILGHPFDVCLDWFLDSRAGGSRFKTWAGQQSVIDIAQSMKEPIDNNRYADVPPAQWLQHAEGSAVTFNFDSDNSVQASPLDVGFSLDPLKMGSSSRPLLELLAFIGLQRFRPAADHKANAYTYTLWTSPLQPVPAAPIAAGRAYQPGLPSFTFPLLYRTKYLKSFLPAQPTGGDQ